MSIQILLRPVQICCLRSVLPVLNFFIQCWEVSAAGGGASFINCKLPALKKMCLSVCVACVSESRNVFVAFFFSTTTRLILEPQNAMKSSESCKILITEQACKTSLQSMHQSQVCIGVFNNGDFFLQIIALFNFRVCTLSTPE